MRKVSHLKMAKLIMMKWMSLGCVLITLKLDYVYSSENSTNYGE